MVIESKEKTLVVGNWKLNPPSLREAEELVTYYLKFLENLTEAQKKKLRTGLVKIIIAVPALYIYRLIELTKDSVIEISAQNCFSENKGAFTGEISAAGLKSLSCNHVIIGHSERREIFLETDQLVNQKIKLAKKQELRPIVCFGESKEHKEQNLTEKIIQKQLKSAMEKVDLDKNFTVAYEPIWAIGTGKTCSAEEAQKICKLIRFELSQNYTKEISEQIPILYGGSLKENNAQEIFRQIDINGGLVGGASLKPKEFVKIIEKALNL